MIAATNINTIRKLLAMTVSQFAKEMGVTTDLQAAIEKKKKVPSIAYLTLLGSRMSIDADKLMSRRLNAVELSKKLDHFRSQKAAPAALPKRVN